MLRKLGILTVSCLALSACGSNSLSGARVATGPEAYRVFTPPLSKTPAGEYRIAPYDSLSVSVFQEPDLSTPANTPLHVDANGKISLPLIGTVPAAGKTTNELASAIASQLQGRYLKNPQVTVAVAGSAQQKLSVQGEVTQPGVYDIKGRTSLLEAIALARGESKLASTREVAVFRYINGQRMGALFNVDAIRRGLAPDPELLPNDVVIVGRSAAKESWQNILSVNPLFGVFRVINNVGL